MSTLSTRLVILGHTINSSISTYKNQETKNFLFNLNNDIHFVNFCFTPFLHITRLLKSLVYAVRRMM